MPSSDSLMPMAEHALWTLCSVVFWTLAGVVIFVLALRLFDKINHANLNAEVFQKENTGACIVYGAAMIAVAILIASAMH